MKVLHVYSSLLPMHAHYVSMLTKAMANADDVECSSLAEPKGIADQCRQWHPDIVHLHGAIDCPTLPHCRLVVSAHGQQPARHDYYAVIAQSPMEHDRLASSFPRIETILNPIITRTISPQQAADQVVKVYRKVMDSNVLELMDAPSVSMLHILLKAGIAGDHRWIEEHPAESHRLPAEPLSVNAWRQLFIYAYQEGVLDIVLHGAELLQLSVPPVRPATINNYVPASYEMPQMVGSASVLALIEQTSHDISAGMLPLCRIAEMHKLLMHGTVDDERLQDELNNRKLNVLASRLMQIASELTLLDEGFMPVSPLNDRQTESLRKLIYKHLKI